MDFPAKVMKLAQGSMEFLPWASGRGIFYSIFIPIFTIEHMIALKNKSCPLSVVKKKAKHCFYSGENLAWQGGCWSLNSNIGPYRTNIDQYFSHAKKAWFGQAHWYETPWGIAYFLELCTGGHLKDKIISYFLWLLLVPCYCISNHSESYWLKTGWWQRWGLKPGSLFREAQDFNQSSTIGFLPGWYPWLGFSFRDSCGAHDGSCRAGAAAGKISAGISVAMDSG